MKMNESPKAVTDRMLAAFASGDVDAILETVSDDTLWIYHGTQVIPKGQYNGKEGVRKFLQVSSTVRKSCILSRNNISPRAMWL